MNALPGWVLHRRAFAPDADGDIAEPGWGKFPPVTDVFSAYRVDDGRRMGMLPKGVELLRQEDLSEQEQKGRLGDSLLPRPRTCSTKLDGVAWRSKPSSYIVATKDRTVQPELQRFRGEAHGLQLRRRSPVATSPCSPTQTLGDQCHPCRRKAVQGVTAVAVSFSRNRIACQRLAGHHFRIARD